MFSLEAVTAASSGRTTAGVTVGLVVGLFLAGVGLFRLRRVRRDRDAPASRRWFGAAEGIATLLLAAMVCLLFANPTATLAVMVIFWFLLVPGFLFVVGGVRRVTEIREDRRLRLGLGMSSLRRRIPWGWVAAAWFVLSIAGYWCFIVVFAFLRPDLSDSAAMFVVLPFPFVVFGGTVVAGFVQAWRRRVRDREIEQDDLDRADLEWVDPLEQAPAWMPTRTGAMWVEWKRSLDEPVEAGQEITHIGVATGAAVVAVVVSAIVAFGIASSTGTSGLARAGLVVFLFVLALGVAFDLFAPTTCGLRTAVRQLRARR